MTLPGEMVRAQEQAFRLLTGPKKYLTREARRSATKHLISAGQLAALLGEKFPESDSAEGGEPTPPKKTEGRKASRAKLPRENFLPPGSKAAREAGCSCPIVDNHHGAGYRGMPGVYCYSGGCKIHNKTKGKT